MGVQQDGDDREEAGEGEVIREPLKIAAG